MTPTVIFIPPHLDTHAWATAIIGAAERAGHPCVFIGEPATPAMLADLDGIVLLQQISPELGGMISDAWIVIGVRSTDTVVDQYLAMHPDKDEAWASTHGSAGLAAAAWIVDNGGRYHLPAKVLDLGGGLVVRAPELPTPSRGRVPRLGFYEDGPVPARNHVWRFRLEGFDADARQDGDWFDLTGRARAILSGPNVFLPPARWRLSATVELDPLGGAIELMTQWGGASLEKAKERMLVDTPGVYAFELEAELDRCDMAEWLVTLDRAHFKGRLRFLGAEIVRLT